MGLFDDLAKAGNALANTVKKAAESEEAKEFISALESAAQDVKASVDEAAANAQDSGANMYAQPQITAHPASCSTSDTETYDPDAPDGKPVDEKIREVMASEFSAYEVREDVSPHTIGGTGRFMNYSFGMYLDGQPKLFIMLVGKTTCAHREYRWSKEQAQAAGVEMINFVWHYPNEMDYIVNRLHTYL